LKNGTSFPFFWSDKRQSLQTLPSLQLRFSFSSLGSHPSLQFVFSDIPRMAVHRGPRKVEGDPTKDHRKIIVFFTGAELKTYSLCAVSKFEMIPKILDGGRAFQVRQKKDFTFFCQKGCSYSQNGLGITDSLAFSSYLLPHSCC
jgi:hypothetical protein